MEPDNHYISAVYLDDATLKTHNAQKQHEREVAINDLIDWNHFTVEGMEGTYELTLGSSENRIIFSIKGKQTQEPLTIAINLSPFRSLIKDYSLICESYFEALKTGNLSRIEAIDMSRRGLHNEGASLILDVMPEKITIDSETARRLFTLIYTLHLKG